MPHVGSDSRHQILGGGVMDVDAQLVLAHHAAPVEVLQTVLEALPVLGIPKHVDTDAAYLRSAGVILSHDGLDV